MLAIHFRWCFAVALGVLLVFSVTVNESHSHEEIKVLSFNVRHGVNFDGEPAMAQQAKVINSAEAALIGLQEIDENCRRSGMVDQTAKFAELAKAEGRFGSFMDFDGGRYGLAVLSKLTIKRTDVVKLPTGREPRVALVLEVETLAATRLLFANVHFDWTTEKLRVPQAKALLAHLKDRDLPTIVLGDYNAKPGSPTLQMFEEAGFEFIPKVKEKRFTFNAREPSIEIDHVAIRGGGRSPSVGGAISRSASCPATGPTTRSRPTASPYRANIAALKTVGATRVLATAVSGSMNPDMEPGALVLISDFLNFSSGRERRPSSTAPPGPSSPATARPARWSTPT